MAGNLAACGVGEYCQIASCDDSMGFCERRPNLSECTANGAFCGCDGNLYYGSCAAAANGINVRNAGACPPLPSGPCSSQADCGGPSYANQVTCMPSSCDSPAGTCTTIVAVCGILLAGPTTGGVCGCDGQTYDSACAALNAGITVAHQGACETP